MAPISYRGHRFPPSIIQHAVWLYLRFTLSYRDVEELLAERGLDISYEAVRNWVLKFGPLIARRLRQRRPRPSDRWHLDEMVVRIGIVTVTDRERKASRDASSFTLQRPQFATAPPARTRRPPHPASQRRRCLVPVDNFYEWKKLDGSKDKQPYAIALADRGVMALAGLWEMWRSPASETVRSFTIVTTTPNELCAPIHNRMPAILAPETWPAWLGEEPAEPVQFKALLAPYPAERMAAWPVSTRIGNVKNNDPSLIELV